MRNERPSHISVEGGAEVPPQVEETEGADAEAREAAEAAEGVRSGILVSLGNKLWERVPGFDIKAARERIQNLKPAEIKKALSTREFWGRAAEKVFTGSSGAVAGRITRYGLGAATGGVGYAIAMGGGAVGGAVVKGLEVYIRERKREISRDEFVEKARALRELREEGGPLKHQAFEEKEQERLAHLDQYLELTKTETPEGSPDETDEQKKEKDDLYRELRKEVGVRWGEVLRGARNGAIVGAIGGAAGEGLMHLLGLRETAQAVNAAQDAVRSAAKTAKDATINEGLCNKMTAAAREASAKTYEKVVGRGIQHLEDQDFIGLIGNGEGTTHVARKMIHDYIAQELALGKNYTPGKAQLVYAEDYLRKVFEKTPDLGIAGGFRIKGEQIRSVIALAGVDDAGEVLTHDQIANLNKNWVGKISEKTWKGMLDYSSVSNPQNNFSEGIFDIAKSQAEQTANGEVARCAKAAAAEASRQLRDKAVRELARASAQDWLRTKIDVGLVGLVGAAAAARFALKKKSKPAKIPSEVATPPEEVPQDEVVEPAVPADDATRKPEVIEPVIPELRRRWWQRRKRDEPSGALREGDHAESKVDEAADTAAALAREREQEERRRQEFERIQEERIQREKEEEFQRKLASDGVPEDLRSHSLEEEKNKLEADPFVRAVRSKGISVDEGSYTYRIPNVEDMGKSEGLRTINFTSYTDYRAYLEKMTFEQRVWVPTIQYSGGHHKGRPTNGIWSGFWGDVEALPEDAKREVYDLMNKAKEGLLADEIREKPEVNNETLNELQDEIGRRFPYDTSGFRVGERDLDIPELQTYNGMKKLMDVLGSFRPPLRLENTLIRISTRSEIGPSRYQGFKTEVKIDPSLSEDRMKEYLERAAEETKRISGKP